MILSWKRHRHHLMKDDNMNQEKVEKGIRTGIMKMIEIIGGMTEMEDWEAEVIKKQDIIKRKVTLSM